MRNYFLISVVAALIVGAVVYVSFDKDKLMEGILKSGLITEKAEISELEFQNAFMDFVATYKKSYASSWEFETRYSIFKNNYQIVADHNLNEELTGVTLKINQFGDLTQQEFKEKYLTLKPREKQYNSHYERFFKASEMPSWFLQNEIARDYPDEIDWTRSGKVQKVKNQGMCGSCWAFSAVGAMESALAIKTGSLPDLSEQQLVDCSTSYGNEGCNGGEMDWAFKYAHDHGMCSEDAYPYKGSDQKCKDSDDKLCEKGQKVKMFVDVTPQSRTAFKVALSQQPLSIGVCADSPVWQFYFGGIVRALCGSCQDHGVLAVGYGTDKSVIFGETEYVKIKNSWGTIWGDKGYIYVAANKETGPGQWGIFMSPSYPTF